MRLPEHHHTSSELELILTALLLVALLVLLLMLSSFGKTILGALADTVSQLPASTVISL